MTIRSLEQKTHLICSLVKKIGMICVHAFSRGIENEISNKFWKHSIEEIIGTKDLWILFIFFQCCHDRRGKTETPGSRVVSFGWIRQCLQTRWVSRNRSQFRGTHVPIEYESDLNEIESSIIFCQLQTWFSKYSKRLQLILKVNTGTAHVIDSQWLLLQVL